MNFFEPINEKKANPKVKKIFDKIKKERKIKFIPNFWRTIANDPDTLDHSMYRFDESPSVLIRKEFANMNPSVAQVYDVRYQLHCCEYCSTFKSKRGYLTNVKWDDRFLIIKGGDEW